VYFPSFLQAKTASEWKSRTIYQILTDRFASNNVDTSKKCSNLSVYCGGNYQGLINKLDYIASMGFDAIWISPMPTNMGNDYHGYAFLDLYSPNPHFGSEADLKAFVTEAHKRDIWVMLDVVGTCKPYFASFFLFSHFFTFNSQSCCSCGSFLWINHSFQ
jgi:alpha-amylase